MFEIIKLISRILSGILPFAGVFCYWMYATKGELGKTTAVLMLCLTCIGMMACILSALGWLRIV